MLYFYNQWSQFLYVHFTDPTVQAKDRNDIEEFANSLKCFFFLTVEFFSDDFQDLVQGDGQVF